MSAKRITENDIPGHVLEFSKGVIVSELQDFVTGGSDADECAKAILNQVIQIYIDAYTEGYNRAKQEIGG